MIRPHYLPFLRELAASEGLSLVVRGDCMEPAVASGARISVHPRRRYLPGDLLVFRTSAGDLAVHRLLGYRWRAGRLWFVTRGDHCVAHDAPVEPASVIGAVDGAPRAAARLAAVTRYAALVAAALSRSLAR